MQPLLRQVPPSLSFSTTATLRPCWKAALATSKPEPLPITIRSNFCSSALSVVDEEDEDIMYNYQIVYYNI
jgi:hypothetical protein